MNQDDYDYFLKKKINSQDTWGAFDSDEWWDDFLSRNPTKEQFINILPGMIASPKFLYSIYIGNKL